MGFMKVLEDRQLRRSLWGIALPVALAILAVLFLLAARLFGKKIA